jgi:hypothetical protein
VIPFYLLYQFIFDASVSTQPQPNVCIDRVFIIQQEEGIFPHQRSLSTDGFDGDDRPADEPPAIAEERRLAYVGFTRARDRLYLTHCTCRKSIGPHRPGREAHGGTSRFLLAIPSRLRQAVTMLGSPSSACYPATDVGQEESGWTLRAMVVLTRAGVEYAAREALEEYGIESISWNQLELVAVGGSCRPTVAATAAAAAAAQLAASCGRPTRGKSLQLVSPYAATSGQMEAVDSLVRGLESGLRFQASRWCRVASPRGIGWTAALSPSLRFSVVYTLEATIRDRKFRLRLSVDVC